MPKPTIPSAHGALLPAISRCLRAAPALHAPPVQASRAISSASRTRQCVLAESNSRWCGGYGAQGLGGYGSRSLGGYGWTSLGGKTLQSGSFAVQQRGFAESRRASYKTVQEQRSRYRSGPFSWRAGLLFLSSGAALIFYFRYEKARLERIRIAEAAKGVGRPKVGGAFNLVDQHGAPFTDSSLSGKYALVYFGFTHCPDICPEELDKMASMIDLVEAKSPGIMRPVFITCDPARDTPAVVKEYLAEFHPAMIGLTGTWEEVKRVCKAYRVYFSTPPNVKPGQDYLVDHSIYFYLMDPEGDFVEAIGRQHSPQRAAEIILSHMGDWRGKIEKS